MPSKEFMERVLGTGRADIIEDEEVEAPEAEVTDEVEAPVEEESEPVEEPEEEGEGEPEEEHAEGGDEDHAEEEGEPPESVHDEDFYLGRYKTREEAEKGWLEKEGMISRQGEELSQLRQQMAEMQGYLQGVQQQPSQPGQFEEWAQAQFESGNAWGGAHEALDAALQSGEPIYVDAYIEQWKEHDPFEAARFRTMVDTQIAQAQAAVEYQNTPAPPQQVLNAIWLEMAAEDGDLANPETAKEIGLILRGNAALRGAATSGVPVAIRDAIAVAKESYKLQAARTHGGTPRKVRSSDAERLQQDKLDATVTTGDSSPERGDGSTPEVPPELQEMLQRVQAGEGGFPRLRE